MYIPPTNSAAQAAGIAAQSAAKDKSNDSAASAATGKAMVDALVEQSGASNPDRDAAGQGDGLPNSERSTVDEADLSSEADESPAGLPKAAPLPGEEPGELDLIG